jgi:YfdX protein
MMKRISLYWIKIGLIFIFLFTSSLHAAADKMPVQSNNATEARDDSNKEPEIVGDQISSKRKEIIKEAVAAISDTKKALLALENENKQGALDALEKALGELEVVLSRDPDLGLAAIDVKIAVYDLYAYLEDIEKAKKQAMDYLEDDEIQKARNILNDLASEIVVSVTNVLLASYPEVIKDVIPRIDAEQYETAKTDLQNALNSLTVTDYIIPLPIVRVSEDIDKIELLTEKTNRTQAENDAIVNLLADAHLQLEMAEALGYGDKKDYQKFHDQLDEIENRVGGIVPGSDYFDEIREFLADFLAPFDKE